MARAVNHPVLGALGLTFLAGALVMMFFVILSGLEDANPLNKTYFLRADTSRITGARDITQWTFFFICGEDNKDCDKAKAALPFGSAWDSNPRRAPESLVGSFGDDTTSKFFWYVWRFGWVFYIIALVFTVLALFSGFLACCGRLGARLAAFAAFIALFFYTVAVSLMTVEFVKARDAFVAEDREASIGKLAFGFSWGAWAALFVALLLFCMGGRRDKTAPAGTSYGRSPSRATGRGAGLHNLFRGKGTMTPGRQVKDQYT